MSQSELSAADPTRAPGWVDQKALEALLAEVNRCRSGVAGLEKEAQDGATALTLLRARRAALDALESYSAALTLRGWPTPRKIVLDIHLLRSLSNRKSRFYR
jgi:hypothetical protein